MVENVAPDVSADATRGLPYYEKLKRDLRETLKKKSVLDKNLATLEETIYRFEASYLEETGAGNIIKGFDNYIKSSSTSSASNNNSAVSGGGTSTRRKGGITDLDRVFSRSSASFMRESPDPSSVQTTPSHALTPTSSLPPQSATREGSHSGAASAVGRKDSGGLTTKKHKKVAEKDEDEAECRQPKRLKITYSKAGT